MNNSRKILYGLVLGLSMLFCFSSCQTGQPESSKQSTSKATAESQSVPAKNDTGKTAKGTQDKIIVIYFHGNIRCPSCIELERLTKSEVETDFADAIRTGKMEWKIVNYDEKQNEHFVADYKLYAQSVVVSTIKDEKEISWKNLNRVWQLVHEEESFREYIKNEVAACLAGKCL